MSQDTNPQWSRHLDGIAEELLKLAIACDLRLRDPGVIERVIRSDETVCGRKNPIAFEKLRKLVMATYNSLGKAIDRIGPEETKQIADAIAERMQARRDAPGTLGDDSG
jgi:hypothetical protein